MLMSFAIFAVSCSASQNAQSNAQVAPQLAGCYALELWPGEAGSDVERQRRSWGVTPTVMLDTARLTEWPGLLRLYDSVFVAYTVTASDEIRDHPFAYWRFISSDSVFVGHPGALAGVSMTLGMVNGDLKGEIISFTDVIEPGQTGRESAPVLARRVDCPGR